MLINQSHQSALDTHPLIPPTIRRNVNFARSAVTPRYDLLAQVNYSLFAPMTRPYFTLKQNVLSKQLLN